MVLSLFLSFIILVLQNGVKFEGKVAAGQSGRFLRPPQLLPLFLGGGVGNLWMLSVASALLSQKA